MKVRAKKTFCTRLKGFIQDNIYEVSEEEYNGFANLVEVVEENKKVESEKKKKNESK